MSDAQILRFTPRKKAPPKQDPRRRLVSRPAEISVALREIAKGLDATAGALVLKQAREVEALKMDIVSLLGPVGGGAA